MKRNKHKKTITIAVFLVVLVVITAAITSIIAICLNRPSQQQKTCKVFTVYEEKVETCLEDYNGLPYQEALDQAKQKGLNAAVTSIDGVPQTITFEWKDILFDVENGLISKAYFDWPAD